MRTNSYPVDYMRVNTAFHDGIEHVSNSDTDLGLGWRRFALEPVVEVGNHQLTLINTNGNVVGRLTSK